jgi:hypothetical protein
MDCGAESQTGLEGCDMNRRMNAGIAVVVVLAVGLFLLMQVWVHRAMAQVEAERAAAEAARLQADAQHALGQANQAIAQTRQPRWEYRVLSIAGSDDAVSQAIVRLTEGGWEYVGVIPPGSEPDRPYARILFKRMK